MSWAPIYRNCSKNSGGQYVTAAGGYSAQFTLESTAGVAGETASAAHQWAIIDNTSLRCEIAAAGRGRVAGRFDPRGGIGRPVPPEPPSYRLAPASATFERLCARMPQPTHRPIPCSPW